MIVMKAMFSFHEEFLVTERSRRLGVELTFEGKPSSQFKCSWLSSRFVRHYETFYCCDFNYHLKIWFENFNSVKQKRDLPGGLLGSDDDSAAPLTDNRNFGRWLSPLGVDDANDLTLLDSGDGVILHQTVRCLFLNSTPTSKTNTNVT